MSNFVSDDFTEEFMEGLSNDKYYLIGAECGAGKTTAIMERLVPFAKEKGKNVLYVCNRVTLKKQLCNKYNEEEIKETGVFKQNETLMIGMYQSITTSLEKNKAYLSTDKYDYIILDEAHLIYDSADYDFNSFFCLEFINSLEAVVIFMSGTSESVKKLEPYMSKELKVIREADPTNNPIRNIYLVESKDTFEQLRFQYVNEDYQWLELVSRSKQFIGLKSKYHNYEVATLLANKNDNKEIFMPTGGFDEEILEGIENNQELFCQLLFTTKFLDVGVNIQAHNHFIAAFNCVEMPNTIEQLRSRIRVKGEEQYHVDLIFYLQRPQKWQLDNLQEKIDYINALYKEFGGYEGVIMEHNHALGKRFRSDGIISEKEFNPITKAVLEDKLEFLSNMYYTKDLSAFYKEFLLKMYPTKEVINYKAVSIEKYLTKLMCGKDTLDLSDLQQSELRNLMKEYRIDPRHSNEIPHLKRINAFFAAEKVPYMITNPRIRQEGQQKRIWRLVKCVV